VSFTNEGSEVLVLIPKALAVPNSGKNIDESWITISPANTTVAPGSVQKFTIDLNAPGDAESGEYQTIIAFTDDFLPNSTQFQYFSTSPTGSENHLSPLRFQTFNRKVF